MAPETSPRILVFAGSARRASLNKHLARAAANSLQQQGADATFIDLRDYPAPLYDGDLEAESGIPEKIRDLKQLFARHDGLLVVSPEYNGFITPLLKNTLDWISRPDGDASGLALFQGKQAAVMSASPGGFGGMRSLQLIRQLLANLGVTVLPDQVSVPRANKAFNDHGEIVDDELGKRIDKACGALVKHLQRLNR